MSKDFQASFYSYVSKPSFVIILINFFIKSLILYHLSLIEIKIGNLRCFLFNTLLDIIKFYTNKKQI